MSMPHYSRKGAQLKIVLDYYLESLRCPVTYANILTHYRRNTLAAIKITPMTMRAMPTALISFQVT